MNSRWTELVRMKYGTHLEYLSKMHFNTNPPIPFHVCYTVTTFFMCAKHNFDGNSILNCTAIKYYWY